MGFCYEKGVGADKNAKKAAELNRGASDGGKANTVVNLADYYIKGAEVDNDEKKGIWFV